jgi:cytochrome c biogenesis protein CcmG/thiol:disulfide interchange protein DsbE
LIEKRTIVMPRIIFGLAACAIIAAVSALNTSAAERPAVAELLKALNASGYPAALYPPEFSGVTINNKKLSMAALRERVVVLNFWATWCLECRPEMQVFQQLHREFETQGLTVIGINARERTPTIREYARELGLSFPLMPDPTGKITSAYGVIGLPTTFIVQRNGRAVALAVGPREWNGAAARSLIAILLAESAQLTGSR